MLFEIALVIIGLIILWGSAEILIKALRVISQHLGISDTFIGLTVLSIGTSLPEIGTHIFAAVNKLNGIDATPVAVGANIGSNLFQITIILGIVACYMRIKATKQFLKQDYMVMMASIGAVFFFGIDGEISRWEGIFLVTAYVIYLYHLGKKEHFVRDLKKKPKMDGLMKQWALMLVGLVALMFSAKLVVENAQFLAGAWNVSGSLIGALMIGIGTALPEFITAMVAIRRKSTGMSVGVLVGSNITNPLFALGLGSIISGHTMTPGVIWFDIPVWFVASLIALTVLWNRGKIQKGEAIVLIGFYVVYYYSRIVFVG